MSAGRRMRMWPATLLFLAACSGGESPSPAASRSSTAKAGPVASGTAGVAVSGDQSFRMDLPVSAGESVLDPGGGEFAFVFKDDDNNLVSLGGSWFEGTRKTSGRLAVSLVFNRSDVIAHTDTDGGCEVTVTRTAGGAQGSFRCGEVEGGRYAAEGNFRIATR